MSGTGLLPPRPPHGHLFDIFAFHRLVGGRPETAFSESRTSLTGSLVPRLPGVSYLAYRESRTSLTGSLVPRLPGVSHLDGHWLTADHCALSRPTTLTNHAATPCPGDDIADKIQPRAVVESTNLQGSAPWTQRHDLQWLTRATTNQKLHFSDGVVIVVTRVSSTYLTVIEMICNDNNDNFTYGCIIPYHLQRECSLSRPAHPASFVDGVIASQDGTNLGWHPYAGSTLDLSLASIAHSDAPAVLVLPFHGLTGDLVGGNGPMQPPLDRGTTVDYRAERQSTTMSTYYNIMLL